LLALQIARHLQLAGRSILGLAIFNSGMSIRLHPEVQAQASNGSWDHAFLRSGFPATTAPTILQTVVRGFDALRPSLPLQDQWHAEPDVLQALAGVPVLIGMDINDRIVSVRKSEQLAQALPHAHCVHFNNTFHYPHLLAPQAVAQAIGQHLLRNERFVAHV
jgi:pimeloyl-ACP methyl ester carboxylesterase